MALFGELSDLSLGELIEFFCNQRKTGRLKVVYPVGPGFFYLKAGAVVHAHFGDLRGIDAVYYALTQPNASFTFNAVFEPPEQTINQPWTSVVLEGLRRMDQGIAPPNPFQNGEQEGQPETTIGVKPVAPSQTEDGVLAKETRPDDRILITSTADDGSPFQYGQAENFQSKRWSTPVVIAAIALLIVGVGVPWGWYAHSKARQPATTSNKIAENPPIVSSSSTSETVSPPPQTETSSNDSSASASADALAAKRLADARTKERAKLLAQQGNPVANTQPETPAKVNPPIQKVPSGGRNVTVQVTYDENGRVTGASGGDATALRIARQRRFPAGKPGSATVTIPIN